MAHDAPAPPPQPALPPVSLTTPSIHEAPHRQRALIVTGTLATGKSLLRALERLEMCAFLESHGRTALRRFMDTSPGLVVLDVDLPDRSGWDVLEEIKANRSAPGRPAILMLGSGDPANRLMARMQRVDVYLPLPVVEAVFSQAVREILSKGSR